MADPKYKLGDAVFVARYGREERAVTCPDCLGALYLTVILGDGSSVTIPCEGCKIGVDAPRGFIHELVYEAKAERHIVTGVICAGDTVEYQLDNHGGGHYYTRDEPEVFRTEEAALAYGNERKVAQEEEENKRYRAKTKDHQAWAWHVTYHRRECKRLAERLAYHQKALAYAQTVAKETSDG